jgi:hypothetical protein
MTERDPKLNILAPVETRPRLDRLERLVRRSGGGRMTRAEALGLGGLALLAAAGCGGKTSTGGGGGGASSSGAADPLAGKPMENNLVIYNWSQYDDPSTYKSFKTQNHVASRRRTTRPTTSCWPSCRRAAPATTSSCPARTPSASWWSWDR